MNCSAMARANLQVRYRVAPGQRAQHLCAIFAITWAAQSLLMQMILASSAAAFLSLGFRLGTSLRIIFALRPPPRVLTDNKKTPRQINILDETSPMATH